MSATPVRKLLFAAGHAFGPLSGLGALDSGPLGDMRPVLGGQIRLPVALSGPILWEMQLSAADEVLDLHISLDQGDALSPVRLHPGRRTEIASLATALPGKAARPLTFALATDLPAGRVLFLSLSVLPLAHVLPTPSAR